MQKRVILDCRQAAAIHRPQPRPRPQVLYQVDVVVRVGIIRHLVHSFRGLLLLKFGFQPVLLLSNFGLFFGAGFRLVLHQRAAGERLDVCALGVLL